MKNASKSQVLKFVQAALGDYCVIIPNHVITVNINSNTGKPEPAIEGSKGARAGVAAETDPCRKSSRKSRATPAAPRSVIFSSLIS